MADDERERATRAGMIDSIVRYDFSDEPPRVRDAMRAHFESLTDAELRVVRDMQIAYDRAVRPTWARDSSMDRERSVDEIMRLAFDKGVGCSVPRGWATWSARFPNAAELKDATRAFLCTLVDRQLAETLDECRALAKAR